MRRVPQQHVNPNVKRERDRRVFTRQTILLASCVVLAVGFILAARQQIAAVQYGYKSEELRRERERLLEEQRRLLLEIEEHSSPANLERQARGLGLQPARASQIGAGEDATTTAADTSVEDAASKEIAKESARAEKREKRTDGAGAAAAMRARR